LLVCSLRCRDDLPGAFMIRASQQIAGALAKPIEV
jgi:hypothetical protein